MLYSHLYSWRNLVEYLNACYYKFACPLDIKKNVKCLPSLYSANRHHRQELFDKYLIQLIHWCEYPGSNHRRRRYKEEVWGWQLCRDWEFKIAYLESIVLFKTEPSHKYWEDGLRDRMKARQEEAEQKEFRNSFFAMRESERKIIAQEKGICFKCASPIIPLMVSCLNCGTDQDCIGYRDDGI